MEHGIEQPTDFLAVSLLAAVSVAVGLTSASWDDRVGTAQSGEGSKLVSTLASILGLDQKQVNEYLQGRHGDVCYGDVKLHSA